MTTVEAAAAAPAAVERDLKAILAGAGYLVMGLLCLLMAAGVPGGDTSTFTLSNGGVSAPDLSVPTQATLWVIAAVCAALGGLQLVAPRPRRLMFTVVVVILGVFAFLVWAAQGQGFNLTSTFNVTVSRATPLALGALAGVLCERSGVVNIAIEGMMLTAAFASAVTASATGSVWAGLLAGILAAAVMAWVHAGLSITYRVDQIISGTVINIFAASFTAYLAARLFTENPALNDAGTFPIIRVPGLSRIPVLGPILFQNNIFVFAMFFLVGLSTWALFRTRWGLRVRAVGEHPRAADTVGINVFRTRYRSVVLGGAAAGLAGTYLTLGSVGGFEDNMTAGRGFIALAAMIFGRWNPAGALGAALVFGFSEALQAKLGLLDTPIPTQVLAMAPYIVTLFAVAGFVGRSRPPAADGIPYVKG